MYITSSEGKTYYEEDLLNNGTHMFLKPIDTQLPQRIDLKFYYKSVGQSEYKVLTNNQLVIECHPKLSAPPLKIPDTFINLKTQILENDIIPYFEFVEFISICRIKYLMSKSEENLIKDRDFEDEPIKLEEGFYRFYLA